MSNCSETRAAGQVSKSFPEYPRLEELLLAVEGALTFLEISLFEQTLHLHISYEFLDV